MASVAAIRDAVKATIAANIAALHVYDTIPDTVNLPAVAVAPDVADFDVAFGRGLDTWEFNLQVLASYADADLGQDSLDSFVAGSGTNSIRQVIFNNRTLGLADGTHAHVARMSGYGGRFEVAAIDHIGAILRLIVHTPGTA